MAKKETLTYEAAMERLETIVQGFEQIHLNWTNSPHSWPKHKS